MRWGAAAMGVDGCVGSGLCSALVGNVGFGVWWAVPAAAGLVGVACFAVAVDNWRTGSAELPVAV